MLVEEIVPHIRAHFTLAEPRLFPRTVPDGVPLPVFTYTDVCFVENTPRNPFVFELPDPLEIIVYGGERDPREPELFDRFTFQISVFAASTGEVRRLADHLIAVVRSYRGTLVDRRVLEFCVDQGLAGGPLFIVDPDCGIPYRPITFAAILERPGGGATR